MAIIITQQPDELSLVKNQVLYKAQTDQYILDVGSPFVGEYNYNFVPANGTVFTLEILGVTYDYLFTSAPTGLGCYEVDITSGDPATVRTLLLAQLHKNYAIERYYTAVIAGTEIIVTAINNGSEYDIIQSGSGSPGTTNTPGVDATITADLGLVWDTYIGNDSASEPSEFIVGQLLRPDANQQIYHDMAELLRKQLSPDIPDYGQAVISYNDKSLKKFKIRHGEFTDGRINCYANSDIRRIMLAGIALERWPFVNFSLQYGFGSSGQKFLSNLPRTIQVDRLTQIFLSILVTDDFDVLVNVLWDDGTTTSNVAIFNVVGNTKSMAIIPAGFDALNLIALMPGTAEYPISYEVFVQQDGGESEHYTFELDTHFKLNPRRFLMHNSLNGWDSIYCTGDQARAVNTVTEDDPAAVPRSFKVDSVETTRIDSPAVKEDPLQTRIFQLNTGYRSREFVETLARELPLSEKVLMDTDLGWREIRVEASSIKEIDNDSDDLWSLTFSYTYGLLDKAY